jgi:hypothetical protein
MAKLIDRARTGDHEMVKRPVGTYRLDRNPFAGGLQLPPGDEATNGLLFGGGEGAVEGVSGERFSARVGVPFPEPKCGANGVQPSSALSCCRRSASS